MNTPIKFSVDKENKKVNVERQFSAPLSKVWSAFTESEILDQWWAPKPWKAETKTMEFTEGGKWIYAMKGPAGEVHWSRSDFKTIKPVSTYTAQTFFCDENGVVNEAFGNSVWQNSFKEENGITTVFVDITYPSVEVLEQMIAMGFKEGFTMGLNNLEEVLSKSGS